MKRLTFLMLIYFAGSITSCCTNGPAVYTYNTIETAKVFLYSFDENGVFPYLEQFNPDELGIAIVPDSLAKRIEVVENISPMERAYACDEANMSIYTNLIDSLNIFTIYDFDINHPAGSNVNDILEEQDPFEKFKKVDITKISSIYHLLKLSASAKNDSVQFKIEGRITDRSNFSMITELVILK